MGERTAAVKLTLRNEGFVAGLRQAKAQTKEFADSVQEGAKRNKGSLDTLAHGFGVAGLAAAGVFAVAVKKFADFDAAMSGVQAATHETAGNMASLREAAVQAGKDTAFSATEAAGAIENLAKAGVTTKDILGGGLKGALDLAAAGSLDVGDAAEIAATAMTQFKLSGKEVPHIADLLAAGAGKAQGEVSDMAMALKQGGLVAAQMGLSIEETTGTLAAFASAGLLGSDAGTSFKTMLLRLANPAADAASKMEELGIAAYDTKGQFVGIAPLAEQLKSKLEKLTPAQRDAALATIFGSDAIRAANVLYQNGAAGIADWTTKVNDQGYAAETAALKTDNLKGDLERLGGAIDTALIQSGEGANDMLRSLVQSADAAVSAFSDLPGWVQQGSLALLAIAAAGGLGAAGIIKGVQAASDLRAALQKLSGVSRGLQLSLGGVGVALLAAGAIYAAFAKHNAEAKRRADELRDTLDEQTGSITGNTRAYVANRLAQSGMAEQAKKFGLELATVTDAALGNQAAIDSVTTALDRIIDQNAVLSNGEVSGELIVESKAAEKLKNEILGLGSGLSEAQKQHQLAAEGAKENKTAQELQAEATKKANEAFVKQAQDLKDVINQMHAASSAALELSGSQIAVEAAIDDATASVKENGRTLDITTEKGRNNRKALNDLAAAANAQTDAMLQSGRSNEEAGRAAASARAQFVTVATQMGLNKRQAQALATALIDIPDAVSTTVSAPGAVGAKTNVDSLANSVRNLPSSKTITITAKINAANIRNKVLDQLDRYGGGSAGGGLIPGTPSNVDNHLRPMATGEFVVQASRVPGNLALLEAINSGRQIDSTRFTHTAPQASSGMYIDYARLAAAVATNAQFTVSLDEGTLRGLVRVEAKRLDDKQARDFATGRR